MQEIHFSIPQPLCGDSVSPNKVKIDLFLFFCRLALHAVIRCMCTQIANEALSYLHGLEMVSKVVSALSLWNRVQRRKQGWESWHDVGQILLQSQYICDRAQIRSCTSIALQIQWGY